MKGKLVPHPVPALLKAQAPYNPRTIEPGNLKRLQNSLERFGQVENVILNTTTGHIVSGHQRVMAAHAAGLDTLDVLEVELTEGAEKALNVALNNPNLMGEWDMDKLKPVLDDVIGAFDIDLEDTGFDLEDYEGMFPPEEETIPPEPQGLPDDIKDWRILNLYAGIGGNRRFWPDGNITAVEFNPEIAECYKKFYPKDEVVVGDAHQYLEDNFDNFDFIWSSPPCPTHSRLRKNISVGCGGARPVYPDMKLYEEILFLMGYSEALWVVENVKGWYDPLVQPQEQGRHYFWANFTIPKYKAPASLTNFYKEGLGIMDVAGYAKGFGYNDISLIPNTSEYPRDKILRNMVHPLYGESILRCAYKNPQRSLEVEHGTPDS